MRNFTWNRFPIKNLLIDSLFTFINIGLVVWNEKKSNCIKPLICVAVPFV